VGGFWDNFISGFCKVEFLCWEGEPNWLGWIVLVFLAFWILAIVINVYFSITE
jgi:hypothetical protein